MAALALAVLVDAVVGGNDAPPAPTTAEARRDAVAALTALGARGRLVYTDRDCRFHSLRLPSLGTSRVLPVEGVSCFFELSPDGTRLATSRARWNGAREYALCTGRYVEVRVSPTEFPRYTTTGCAPAWRPGSPSTLTLARAGEVVGVAVACTTAPCERVLIDRRAILAAARQHPNVPDAGAGVEGVEVEDVAWLSPRRVVLLLELRIAGVGPQDLVAVFEGGRVRGSYFFLDDDRNRLEVSRRGRYFAAGTGFAARADGPRLAVPNAFGRVRALAWSPDERWLAVAARGTLALVRVGAPGAPRIVTLPIDAADVAWAPR